LPTSESLDPGSSPTRSRRLGRAADADRLCGLRPIYTTGFTPGIAGDGSHTAEDWAALPEALENQEITGQAWGFLDGYDAPPVPTSGNNADTGYLLSLVTTGTGAVTVTFTFTLFYVRADQGQNADIWVGQPTLTGCVD